MRDQELQELRDTVARLEAASPRNAARAHGSSLSRARGWQRFAMWLGAAGLCSVPLLGWAAVELTSFAAGDVISADDVNANFSNLAAAVTELQDARAGEPVLGAAVPSWDSNATESTDPNAVVDGLEVELETHGRAVSVHLAGTGGQPFLGAGNPGNSTVEVTYRLERQTTGEDVDWVSVEDFYWRVDGAAATVLRVPPSSVRAVDVPPAGTTTYRMVAWVEPSPGSPGLDLARVRLVAQELAATSSR